MIFEVKPAADRRDEYFDLAAELRPTLEKIDGFVSIERFQSLVDPQKVLSLSFFRDEQAISDWRNTPEHRSTQKKGRAGVFDDYRLRVAHVVRDYGIEARDQAPADSQAVHPPRPAAERRGVFDAEGAADCRYTSSCTKSDPPKR